MTARVRIITLAGLALALAVSTLAVTAAARAGRGRLQGDRFRFTLTGAQEVPPNGSLATGRGEITLTEERMRVKLEWRDLSGPVTGAHLHGPATVGKNAPVVFDLVPGRLPAGSPSPIEVEFETDHAQRNMLRAGLCYASIHTALYPGGEIRGRVLPEPGD